MPKPLPCMWCESEQVELYGSYITLGGRDLEGYAVYCNSCGIRGPHSPLEGRAVREWNDLVVASLFYKKCKETEEL